MECAALQTEEPGHVSGVLILAGFGASASKRVFLERVHLEPS
jgi:hypothetical protein